MKSIPVPMQSARIKPDSNIAVRDLGAWVIFGGLVREPEFELTRLAAEFWEEGRANGKLVRKGDFSHALAVNISRSTEWWPCSDAADNIDAKALQQMNVGDIMWLGALGSSITPLHAGYKLAGKGWVTGENNWSWRQAIEAMMAAAGISQDNEAFMSARRNAAQLYAEGVVAEHRKIRRGDVFGVVAYAVPKGSTGRSEDFDFEVWGHVGIEHATAALEDALDDIEHKVTW